MRSTGIVAEYNPFHNGHHFHVQETKRLSQADIIIAVISGDFLQRGEPALVSKWARTNMALQSGVDVVIELPYAFAVQKAETFAYGAVYILNALKCNNICFGSENGELAPFLHTLKLIENNKHQYENSVRTLMKKGISYPSALGAAFAQLESVSNTLDLSKPNNILGYHYIAAAKKINPQMNFHTIQRKNADYHEENFTNESIASATSIRKSLNDDLNLQKIRAYIPESSLSELTAYLTNFKQFHHWEHYWPFLQYKLLTMESDELREVYEMEEGIENRLKKAASSADSFHAFMSSIKTKRYTWTRLQRICVHLLMNTSKALMKGLDSNPQYARLLGMSSDGREYLRSIKKDISLPLVSKVSAHDGEMLQMDIRAANVYAHGLPEPYRAKLFAMEYGQPPIIR